MDISNTISPKYGISFQSIQHCCKLGNFSKELYPPTSSTKLVEDSFNNSEILQKYCKENDVHLIMASNILPNCKKKVAYACLELSKMFPKKELSLFGKILNLFKKQPRESILIRTYADNGVAAREDLAKCINDIKTKADLQQYISYKKYNPIVMQKCSTCGWNID